MLHLVLNLSLGHRRSRGFVTTTNKRQALGALAYFICVLEGTRGIGTFFGSWHLKKSVYSAVYKISKELVASLNFVVSQVPLFAEISSLLKTFS